MTSKEITGRPKIEIDYDLVREYAAEGLTDLQLAARLGLSRQTIYNRKQNDAEFLAAYQQGEAEALAEVETTLFKLAKEGDAGACKFILSTRRREIYTTRSEVANANGEAFRVDVMPLSPEDRQAAVVEIVEALNDEA